MRRLVRLAWERARGFGPALLLQREPAFSEDARILELGLGRRTGGRRDAGDAEARGRICRGGAREAEKVAAARSPVACSQPPEVAVVKLHLGDFLHPGSRVSRLSSVVTLSPEGCLTSHPET